MQLLNKRFDFEAMHSRFRTPILRFISEKISDPQTAEELTQDVFLKAYRARDSYQEKYEFSTWLWTIAKNTTFDWLRRQKEDPLPSLDEFSWEHLPSPSPCPETQASLNIDRRVDRKTILKLMKSLTHLQRRALLMRVVRQLSYEEISKNLGLSLSAAKCLVYRARACVQESMKLRSAELAV